MSFFNKPSKFSVGDRVKVSREERFGKGQRRGVVIHTHQTRSHLLWWYRVEFDAAPTQSMYEGQLEPEPPLETLARCGSAT